MKQEAGEEVSATRILQDKNIIGEKYKNQGLLYHEVCILLILCEIG